MTDEHLASYAQKQVLRGLEVSGNLYQNPLLRASGDAVYDGVGAFTAGVSPYADDEVNLLGPPTTIVATPGDEEVTFTYSEDRYGASVEIVVIDHDLDAYVKTVSDAASPVTVPLVGYNDVDLDFYFRSVTAGGKRSVFADKVSATPTATPGS